MEKEEHRCRRGACKSAIKRAFYRIWNDPITELGYRDYCVKCGRKIIEYNKQMFEDYRDEKDVLKYEIILEMGEDEENEQRKS